MLQALNAEIQMLLWKTFHQSKDMRYEEVMKKEQVETPGIN